MQHIHNLFLKIANAFIKFLSLFIKRNDKYITFGSWKGEKIADSSRFLMDYILKNYPEYKCIWVLADMSKADNNKYPNVEFVKKNSFRQIITSLKSKYTFVTQPIHTDLSRYNCFDGAINTYLNHGFALKSITNTSYNNFPYNYYLLEGTRAEEAKKKIYADFSTEKFLPFGTPREDYLINADDAEKERVKKKFAQKYGFEENKKIITFMPTFRQHGDPIASFLDYGNESKRLVNILNEKNAVLIEKFHRTTFNQQSVSEYNDGTIINIDASIESQELLLITDILICDYSSCLIDFLPLDRPALFYIYDYDFYANQDQGLFFSIDEYGYGPIAKDFKTLCDEISYTLDGKDDYVAKREEVKSTFCNYFQGDSCEKICKKIIGVTDNAEN